MFRSPRRFLLASAAALLFWTSLANPASATDPILQIYDASLTTYLPDTESALQDVVPQHGQRAVGLDGALRAGSPLFRAPNGNPFSPTWRARESIAGVNLATGAPDIWEVDLALPSEGVPWVVGRSYNNRQIKTAAHHDSDGIQGKNWVQISFPELVRYQANGPGDHEDDVLYLVFGADRFLEFERVDIVSGTSDEFIAVNGGAGIVTYRAPSGSDPEIFTYYDQVGTSYEFFGFDGNAGFGEGQLWRITDTAGIATYVGHASTAATAISSGFSANGPTKVYDDAGSTDRRYTYTYDGNGRLTEVSAETRTGGTWASPTGVEEVGKVEYSYYGSSESHGLEGDLKLVTITTPLTDSGIDLVKRKYYRYWKDADSEGSDHDIKLVLGFEGARRYDWQDSSFNQTYTTASDSALETYAEARFEYDSNHRVTESFTNGECGCSGSGDGVHRFEYETNGSYSNGSGYDQTWAARTVIQRPDNSYVTLYFDEAHQPLTRVITAADPDNTSPTPDRWVTKVTRNTDGIVTDVHSPANITGYTHSSGAITTSTSAGLVWTYSLINASSATDGFASDHKWKEGTTGSAYLDRTFTYDTSSYIRGDATVIRPVVASERTYTNKITSGTTGSVLVSYTTAFIDSETNTQLALEKITTTLPKVTAANNGSDSEEQTLSHYDASGRHDYTKSPDGYISHTEFTNGLVSEMVEDADTGRNQVAETFHQDVIPSGFSSSDPEMHWATEYSYDSQGRLEQIDQPGGQKTRHYRSRLADHREVVLIFNDVGTSPTKYYGPVSYRVTNHAGQVEASGTIALSSNETTTALTSHIDETDDDLITAIDEGTLSALRVSVYDSSGSQLDESRLYFSIPASGDGTEGTHYDATYYGYDDRGRRTRTKEPSGTIRRTAYSLHGDVSNRYIGTNDSSFDGGESSGTDNMVKTETLEYDSGNDEGNRYPTKRTLYVEDSTTDQRVTEYTHDARGNMLLEKRPVSPHLFHKYDNLSRRIATGTFSSTASITASSDDPTTETTNRLGLQQMFYDELGRVWKEQVHKIDDSDGSDDDTLVTERWWDSEGRLAKVDGQQLEKYAYDRLGRQTHRFVMASDNDTAYADAIVLDATHDLVLEEHQTTYDAADGDVIMVASIERLSTDGSTGTKGPLDGNQDGDRLKYTAANLEGRIQITAYWHGIQGVTDQVRYGDYNGADFDRDGLSVPARSDTALRTSYTYNGDGTLHEIEDPRGHETQFDYDDAGRKTKEVRNYVDGTPSASDDQTVAFQYTDGLMTKRTADVPGSSDQETTYTYGTTKGTTDGDSKIATGHLLWETEYPDSGSSTDVVNQAYNAQGEEIWRRDQSGTVFKSAYDTGGRRTQHRVTSLASGLDGAIRRREYGYNDRDQLETVTQYDNAAVGSGTVQDEVKYTYDDWGNVEQFDQDRNSTVASSGGDEYTVSYTYAKATGGRNTVRRTAATLPGGTSLTYNYLSTSNRHDDNASRLTTIKKGAVTLVEYDYDGLAAVTKTTHPQVDIFSDPVEDRFQRVTTSLWTKDLSTDKDFYKVWIQYDRNSNITVVNDAQIHTGFDTQYTMDGLDRLTRAQRGKWNGSSIINEKEDQNWTLDPLGNWDQVTLDLNADGVYTGTDEYDDDRTHNTVNELTARDTDDNGSNDHSLSYDQVGNLTDDDENYRYEYDAFGQLRKVKTSDVNEDLVAEYKYNGLGHLISVHADTDTDGDVDGDDKWYHYAYDERWRWLSTFRESDSDAKEDFVPHQAGLDGAGGSSYINSIVLRYRDDNTAWTAASDGTMEQEHYYFQNWRGDVVMLVSSGSDLAEWIWYMPYGTPIALPAGDLNSDGDCDMSDISNIQTLIMTFGYKIPADLDMDGDVDANDKQAATDGAITLGRGISSSVANRVTYSGHTTLELLGSQLLARSRLASSILGRWNRRDPAGYIDGPSLYQALRSSPVTLNDPLGRFAGQEKKNGSGGDMPPYGPPPPPWYYNCCKDAWDKAQAKGKSPLGRVACCGGEVVTCNFVDLGLNDGSELGLPSLSGSALAAISKCIQVQEDDHQDYVGPDACEGKEDTEMPSGMDPLMEIRGYRLTDECLETACEPYDLDCMRWAAYIDDLDPPLGPPTPKSPIDGPPFFGRPPHGSD